MAEETFVGGGQSHQRIDITIPLEGSFSLHPVKVVIVPGDTVESIKDKSSPPIEKSAASPDLAQGEWLLWWAATSNSYTLQSSGNANLIKVDPAPNPGLAVLKEQNALMAIGTKALTAWSENLREEAKAVRRELNSDSHRQYLEARGKAGFEAYLNTLTVDQRDKAVHSLHLERLAKVDEALAQGLDDYLSKNSAGANISFMLGVMSVGASSRFDAASGSEIAVGGQSMINPVGVVAETVIPKVMPTYSVEMGTLASMFGVGTVYSTIGQTLAGGVVPKEPLFSHKFAENYAQQILKTVNGSEFNTLAMALVAAQSTEGQPLSKKRKLQLINTIKTIMLSSALILLYKTESAFKGQGGGITEIEYEDMVMGVRVGENRTDLAGEIATAIRTFLATIPERDVLLSAIKDYIASNPKTSSLINLESLFAGIGKRIAVPEVKG